MTDPYAPAGITADPRGSGPSLDVYPDPIRIRLDIAYDGSDFCGWAVQPDQRSVQADVEAALALVLRLDRVRLVVAGRTDAGVHAIGQVAHVDLPGSAWPDRPAVLLRRLAGVLAPDVRVLRIAEAPAGFDARFSALWRRYQYRVTDADHGADPLRRSDTTVWPRRLDVVAMQNAAVGLLGVHDFAAYCRHRANATTVRGLQDLVVSRALDVITVEARADAFCHSMVRSLVGAIIEVGEGRRPIDWPGSLLTLRSRSSAVRVAPARGLTLVEVRYPPADELARRAKLTRTVREAIPVRSPDAISGPEGQVVASAPVEHSGPGTEA